MHRITARNARFFERNRPALVRKSISLEELLSVQEIKKLIVEFIIYTRITRFLTGHVIKNINPDAIIHLQLEHYSQELFLQISQHSFCKKNQGDRYLIERKIKPLLDELMLLKTKNDEWALQYIARFFSNRSSYQRFFYDCLFHSLIIKIQWVLEKNPRSAVVKKYVPYFHTFREATKNNFTLYEKFIGQKEVATHYQVKFIILFLIIMNIAEVCFHLFKLLPSLINEPYWTYVLRAISIYSAVEVSGRWLSYLLGFDPYSWSAAGPAIQFGLLEEINNALSVEYHPIKRQSRIFEEVDSSPAEELKLMRVPLPLSSAPSISMDSAISESEEAKPKQKRKDRTMVPSYLAPPQEFPLLKLTWEDSSIEPLLGILKNDKIDFILRDGVSRAWSLIPQVDASCRYHFFSTDLPMDDAASETLQRIISMAHVVPQDNHPGIVRLKKNDRDFPGAQFKAKNLCDETATSRVGLFAVSRSKSLEFVNKTTEQKLPDTLCNKVFYFNKPGEIKRPRHMRPF